MERFFNSPRTVSVHLERQKQNYNTHIFLFIAKNLSTFLEKNTVRNNLEIYFDVETNDVKNIETKLNEMGQVLFVLSLFAYENIQNLIF